MSFLGITSELPLTIWTRISSLAAAGSLEEATVDVIQISNQSSNETLPDLPHVLYGVVAFNCKDIIMICGGYDTNQTSHQGCFRYNATSHEWNEGPKMIKQRTYAHAIQLNEDEFWITGGWRLTSSTEIYNSLDDKFVPGPDLPQAIYGHCMTQANSSHMIMAGGRVMPAGQAAYLFEKSTNVWTKLKNMTSLRDQRPGCFTFERNGGLYLIVAGGNFAPDSEIYSFATETWTEGPALPHIFRWGASTLYQDTFIMVMGALSKYVIEYDRVNNSFFVWAREFENDRHYMDVVFLSSIN